jgi:hypothetical protein
MLIIQVVCLASEERGLRMSLGGETTVKNRLTEMGFKYKKPKKDKLKKPFTISGRIHFLAQQKRL